MVLAAAGQNHVARSGAQPCWHTTHCCDLQLAQTLLYLALRPAGALPMLSAGHASQMHRAC